MYTAANDVNTPPYQEAFEAVGNALAVLDAAGRTVAVNPAFSRLCNGADETEITNRCVESLGDEVAQQLAAFACDASSGDVFSAAVPQPEATGEVRDLEVRGQRFEADGEAYTLLFIRDITEERRAQRLLIVTQQLAAAGTLADGVAHQFNNLHAVVTGYLQLVLRPDNDQLCERDRRRLQAAQTAVTQATEITRNLVQFSQQESHEKRPTALDAPVAAAVRVVAPELQLAGIDLIQRLGGSDVTVCVDGARIRQATVNLLINARHALLGRKTRQITVRTGLISADTAFISVADTGCGIAVADLQRVFLPFFSTKGEHAGVGSPQTAVKGTGLGLSVCDTIIRDHGGSIDAVSTPEVGTTFTIRLPVVPAATTPPAKAPPSETPPPRIVVLDDEEMIRLVLAEFLTENGYDVVTFGDGLEALRYLRVNLTDLVVVDLQMPGMPGMDVVRELRRLPLARQPAVVMTTGKLMEGTPEQYTELNVGNLLHKPFDWGAVAKQLENAIRAGA